MDPRMDAKKERQTSKAGETAKAIADECGSREVSFRTELRTIKVSFTFDMSKIRHLKGWPHAKSSESGYRVLGARISRVGCDRRARDSRQAET
jgi:hypothetical protein